MDVDNLDLIIEHARDLSTSCSQVLTQQVEAHPLLNILGECSQPEILSWLNKKAESQGYVELLRALFIGIGISSPKRFDELQAFVAMILNEELQCSCTLWFCWIPTS